MYRAAGRVQPGGQIEAESAGIFLRYPSQDKRTNDDDKELSLSVMTEFQLQLAANETFRIFLQNLFYELAYFFY